MKMHLILALAVIGALTVLGWIDTQQPVGEVDWDAELAAFMESTIVEGAA
jgi:hypothetical protein